MTTSIIFGTPYFYAIDRAGAYFDYDQKHPNHGRKGYIIGFHGPEPQYFPDVTGFSAADLAKEAKHQRDKNGWTFSKPSAPAVSLPSINTQQVNTMNQPQTAPAPAPSAPAPAVNVPNIGQQQPQPSAAPVTVVQTDKGKRERTQKVDKEYSFDMSTPKNSKIHLEVSAKSGAEYVKVDDVEVTVADLAANNGLAMVGFALYGVFQYFGQETKKLLPTERKSSLQQTISQFANGDFSSILPKARATKAPKVIKSKFSLEVQAIAFGFQMSLENTASQLKAQGIVDNTDALRALIEVSPDAKARYTQLLAQQQQQQDPSQLLNAITAALGNSVGSSQ